MAGVGDLRIIVVIGAGALLTREATKRRLPRDLRQTDLEDEVFLPGDAVRNGGGAAVDERLLFFTEQAEETLVERGLVADDLREQRRGDHADPPCRRGRVRAAEVGSAEDALGGEGLGDASWIGPKLSRGELPAQCFHSVGVDVGHRQGGEPSLLEDPGLIRHRDGINGLVGGARRRGRNRGPGVPGRIERRRAPGLDVLDIHRFPFSLCWIGGIQRESSAPRGSIPRGTITFFLGSSWK